MYTCTDRSSCIQHEVKYSWGCIELRVSCATGLGDISIHVEEEYRGKGFSRQLMRDLAYSVPNPPKVVYIDTDASSGFWDKVGFKPNPDLDNESVPSFGYEKCIDWQGIVAFGKN